MPTEPGAALGSPSNFHAHVFFTEGAREQAERVAEGLRQASGLSPSAWTDRPGGPLPLPMFQLEFPATAFGAITAWLMLHRDGLSVLLHPETGDDLRDHTEHAAWLGPALQLRLDRL
jgi:aromatic ring-cleaving dioxygenase